MITWVLAATLTLVAKLAGFSFLSFFSPPCPGVAHGQRMPLEKVELKGLSQKQHLWIPVAFGNHACLARAAAHGAVRRPPDLGDQE